MKAFRRQQGFTLIDMLVVIALMAIVIAIALPTAGTTSRGFRMKGDAQAVANIVSLAKMRAASRYSRTRVRADLANQSFRLEVWVPNSMANKLVGSWVVDGGDIRLSNGVTFSLAAQAAAPPNTQAVLGQSPPCSDQNSLTANKVANTACIVFNSRGIPIDDNGDPMGGNALYISDGSAVYGTTITATPLVRQWWANSTNGAWVKQ